MLLLNSGRFSGFSPLSIASCTAWWDAQDPSTITESGGEVTAWDDKKGTAHWAKDVNGPTDVQYSEGHMLRFDSSNSERMKVTSSAMDPGAGDITYIIVYRCTNNSKGTMFGKTGTGAREYSLHLNDGAAEKLSVDLSDSAGSPVATTVDDTNFYADGQVRFMAITFDATANVVKLYADDFDAASEVATDASYNPGTIDPTNPLFLASLDGTADYFEGSIGEIACFSEVLSTADMALMETRIRNSWQLTSFTIDPGVSGLPKVGNITGRWSSFDPSDYTLVSGEVTQLNDISTNSNHMVNGFATTATGPDILTLDGSDWLTYAGAQLLGVTESATDPGAGDHTVIAVFRCTTNNYASISGKLGSGNPHYLLSINAGTPGNLYTQLRDTVLANVSIISATNEDYSDSTKRICARTYDDSEGDNILYGRSAFKSVASDLVYSSVTISPSNPCFIGSTRDDGTQLYIGQLAEIIYFDDPLNFNDLNAWYHYLKRKFGLYNK